jgi:CRP/FNR family transcriptional regulator
LLDWSDSRTTEPNGRIRFSLTHEEIGQFIGATRETVTRTLSIFKERHLVSCNGSTLTIADRSALEHYALA